MKNIDKLFHLKIAFQDDSKVSCSRDEGKFCDLNLKEIFSLTIVGGKSLIKTIDLLIYFCF